MNRTVIEVDKATLDTFAEWPSRPMPARETVEDISLPRVAEVIDPTVESVRIERRGIESRREDARTAIALIVVGCFAAVVAFSFGAFWWRGTASVDGVIRLVQALIAPVAAIADAVTGFYFSLDGRGTRNSR